MQYASGVPLIIGAQGPAGRQGLHGIVDDVALFDTALDEAEINAIMTQGLGEYFGYYAVNPGDKLATTWARVKAE